MRFEDALSKIEGAQSAGGQLIVIRNGKHVLVGKHVQGTLIVENTDEARAVVAELTTVSHTEVEGEPPEPTQLPAEPVTAEIAVEDAVKTSDRTSGRRK